MRFFTCFSAFFHGDTVVWMQSNFRQCHITNSTFAPYPIILDVYIVALEITRRNRYVTRKFAISNWNGGVLSPICHPNTHLAVRSMCNLYAKYSHFRTLYCIKPNYAARPIIPCIRNSYQVINNVMAITKRTGVIKKLRRSLFAQEYQRYIFMKRYTSDIHFYIFIELYRFYEWEAP